MELEHRMLRDMIRISSKARRKLPKPPAEHKRRHRGYGRILDLLSQNNGLSQQQIAQMLGIRPQSVSEAVTNMESRGLVRKAVNEQDRRGYLIYITQEGLERQAEIHDEFVRNARTIFAPLNEEEKNDLQRLLEKVISALEESKEEK